MVILFAPSEGKRPGGELPPLELSSLIFPDLYPQRRSVLELYGALVGSSSNDALSELFGLKDPSEFERYKTPLESAPAMKAVLRYDGVAYDYLDYPSLPPEAQEYIDRNVILFSNLFGPIGAGDQIPDYKLKQGSSIGGFAPEKHYRNHFSEALDEWIGEREILDLRAGFYDKFYIPKNPPVTLKFLKEGKVVSHWAKAYRGIVLREAALHAIGSVEALMVHAFEGLEMIDCIETKKKKEIVYRIV